jgi:hypothetical protein
VCGFAPLYIANNSLHYFKNFFLYLQ